MIENHRLDKKLIKGKIKIADIQNVIRYLQETK